MIKAVLVFNNNGKPRLMKFYTHFSVQEQQKILSETFQVVTKTSSESCNFVENISFIGGNCNKIMFRHFTTLYFVFCCDSSESELAILDLIQVFVEALDKCFKNVCELDLIFHADRAHYLLDEIVMGGVVLDTDIATVLNSYYDQMRLQTNERRITPMITMPGLPSLPHFTEYKLDNVSFGPMDLDVIRI